MQNGGSIVTLSYIGGKKVIPNYNVMGVAKAALEWSADGGRWDESYLVVPEKMREPEG
jgi:NADP-dependent 3-hydroxy acid dehydrogenase YdfG